MSHRTVIYKSMALARELAHFYPDLADTDYQTALVLFHQRFSTKTLPPWREPVVAFMNLVAEEVRLILAEMGFRTLDEIVGRVDLLQARR